MQLMNESRFNRFARWESTTVKILGSIEMIFSVLLVVPTLFALYYGEDVSPFVYLSLVLLVIGTLQFTLFRESKNFHTVNGLLLVGLAWGLVFLIGSIPFIMSGVPVIDAVFESVSGMTSTGATILTDMTAYTKSFMAWRGMTQWIGGIAVIIIFMYILPLFGMGRNFFRNELAGSGSSEYSMKMKNAAKSFVKVYMIMTGANFVLLLLAGVNLLDSFVMSMTTISTGGMMTTGDSLTGFSDLVQIITIVFMFLGGANFYLHYRAIYKHESKVYRGNSEFKYFVVWLFSIAFIMYVILVSKAEDLASMTVLDHLETFKETLFTTVSMGTSTAFSITDFGAWPPMCILLLMLVSFIGGSSGSTSGGVKFGRLLTVFQYVKVAMRKNLKPNAVINVKMDGQILDDGAVMSAISIFVMYVATMAFAAAVIMLCGYDFVDSFGLSIATVSNIGTGFGTFGPTGTWSVLSPGLKIFIMFLMWVGRLEIMIALMFFTPSFWKEMWLNHRASKKAKKHY